MASENKFKAAHVETEVENFFSSLVPDLAREEAWIKDRCTKSGNKHYGCTAIERNVGNCLGRMF